MKVEFESFQNRSDFFNIPPTHLLTNITMYY